MVLIWSYVCHSEASHQNVWACAPMRVVSFSMKLVKQPHQLHSLLRAKSAGLRVSVNDVQGPEDTGPCIWSDRRSATFLPLAHSPPTASLCLCGGTGRNVRTRVCKQPSFPLMNSDMKTIRLLSSSIDGMLSVFPQQGGRRGFSKGCGWNETTSCGQPTC